MTVKAQASGRRLSRDARRAQLLDAAATIVRAEGTEALTLARVAEAAGVTKPIAYAHFGTRAGMLIALYRHFDARQAEAVRAALKTRARTLEDAVSILADAYVGCVLDAGKEFGAITAALSATEEMDAFRHAMREEYVTLYQDALGRFGGNADRAVMLGIIGAADTLGLAAATARLSRAEAVAALSQIMLGTLKGG